MKKALAILGYITTSMIIFGCVFKIMHWPGAGPLIVFGNLLFIVAFLPVFLAYRISTKETELDLAKGISLTVALFIYFLGTMFKVMHWPGSGPMLLIGSTLFVISIAPYMISFILNKRYKEPLNIVGLLIGIAGVCLLFAIKENKNVLYSYVNNIETISSCNTSLMKVNEHLASLNDRTLPPAEKEKMDSIRILSKQTFEFIEGYKTQLIKVAGGSTTEPNKLSYSSPIDNYDIPTYMLIGDINTANTGEWSAVLLKQTMQQYFSVLAKSVHSEQANLDLNKYLEGFNDLYDAYQERKIPWEIYLFDNTTMALTIKTLSNFQNEILLGESIVLNDIIKNHPIEL